MKKLTLISPSFSYMQSVSNSEKIFTPLELDNYPRFSKSDVLERINQVLQQLLPKVIISIIAEYEYYKSIEDALASNLFENLDVWEIEIKNFLNRNGSSLNDANKLSYDALSSCVLKFRKMLQQAKAGSETINLNLHPDTTEEYKNLQDACQAFVTGDYSSKMKKETANNKQDWCLLEAKLSLIEALQMSSHLFNPEKFNDLYWSISLLFSHVGVCKFFVSPVFKLAVSFELAKHAVDYSLQMIRTILNGKILRAEDKICLLSEIPSFPGQVILGFKPFVSKQLVDMEEKKEIANKTSFEAFSPDLFYQAVGKIILSLPEDIRKEMFSSKIFIAIANGCLLDGVSLALDAMYSSLFQLLRGNSRNEPNSDKNQKINSALGQVEKLKRDYKLLFNSLCKPQTLNSSNKTSLFPLSDLGSDARYLINALRPFTGKKPDADNYVEIKCHSEGAIRFSISQHNRKPVLQNDKALIVLEEVGNSGHFIVVLDKNKNYQAFSDRESSRYITDFSYKLRRHLNGEELSRYLPGFANAELPVSISQPSVLPEPLVLPQPPVPPQPSGQNSATHCLIQ